MNKWMNEQTKQMNESVSFTTTVALSKTCKTFVKIHSKHTAGTLQLQHHLLPHTSWRPLLVTLSQGVCPPRSAPFRNKPPKRACRCGKYRRIKYTHVVSVPRRPSLAVWADTANTAIWYSVEDIKFFNTMEDTLPSATTCWKNGLKRRWNISHAELKWTNKHISTKSISVNILLFVWGLHFHCRDQVSLSWCISGFTPMECIQSCFLIHT